jgi:hypothetical protein
MPRRRHWTETVMMFLSYLLVSCLIAGIPTLLLVVATGLFHIAWNWFVVPVFGATALTYWQSLGGLVFTAFNVAVIFIALFPIRVYIKRRENNE